MITFKDAWGEFSLSPSTLKTATCPLALDFKLSKEPRNKMGMDLARIGIEEHAIYDAIIKNRITTDEALDEAIANIVTIDHERIRKNALRFIKSFPLTSVVASELRLGLDKHLKPTDFDNATFRGVVDVVLKEGIDSVTIVDHKTGFATYDPDIPQLHFYAWLIWKHYKYKDIGMAINFTRYAGMRYAKRRLRIEDIANIEHSILAQAKSVWNTKYPARAKAGEYCSFCNWRHKCPIIGQMPDVINSPEEAREVAEYITATSKSIEAKKKELKKWVEQNGPVEIEGIRYDYTPSIRREYDPDEVLEKMKEFPSLKETIKIDGHKLEDHPAGLHFREVITTRFGGKKT